MKMVRHLRLGSTKNFLLSKQLVVNTDNRGVPGILWNLGHLFSQLLNPSFSQDCHLSLFFQKLNKRWKIPLFVSKANTVRRAMLFSHFSCCVFAWFRDNAEMNLAFAIGDLRPRYYGVEVK